MRIIKKYLYGGPSPLLTAVGARQATGDTSDKNALPYFLPIVGTYLTFKDGNTGLGLLSALGDLGTAGLLGGAFKTARAANQASRAARAAETAVEASRKAAMTAATNIASAERSKFMLDPLLLRSSTARKSRPVLEALKRLSSKKSLSYKSLAKEEEALMGRLSYVKIMEPEIFIKDPSRYPLYYDAHNTFPVRYLDPLEYAEFIRNGELGKGPLIQQMEAALAAEAAAIEASKDLSPYILSTLTHFYPHILDYAGRSE